MMDGQPWAHPVGYSLGTMSDANHTPPNTKTESESKHPAKPADRDLTYEAAVEELESIIDQIESGEIGLEQSIRRYERGATLLRHCRAILDQAEQRISTLDAAHLDAAQLDDGARAQSGADAG